MTEKKQLHLVATKGDTVYHREKKKIMLGGIKSFVPFSTHQN